MNYLPIYAVIVLLVMLVYIRRQRQIHHRNMDHLQQSLASGQQEPGSRHPLIDLSRCIGSGTCAKACPEQALGLINGKMVLKNAGACIGHGQCQTACPVDAIQLVFGTPQRGVDIPFVQPNLETNVPGLFIAGELGGMGLIHKAVQQGREAMRAIEKRPRSANRLDVLIVGAGPAGLSAGLSAIHHGLSYQLIEQEASLGGAIQHYPRQKLTMTAPLELDLMGKVNLGEIPKEKLIRFWQHLVEDTGLHIGFQERLEGIERRGDHFRVHTSQGHHDTNHVLLALGRQGSPRQLQVPGEDTAKVTYRLQDAEQYAGQSVLVVGGGNSALEAAIALAQVPRVKVTLACRRDRWSSVTARNRSQLEELRAAKRVQVLMRSEVLHIRPERVTLSVGGHALELINDAVIVCAGGQLPTALLQKVGIRFETKYGTA